MAFELLRSHGLALNVVARALVLSAVGAALLQLLVETHYYATALVLLILAAIVVADLVAITTRAERATERFLAGLAAGSLETPAVAGATPAFLQQAHALALARVSEERRRQLRRGEYLQTLLDTVPAAMLVVDASSRLRLVNRMAHALLGAAAPTLSDLPVLSESTAAQLESLTPGSHRVVHLADGRALLASSSQFVSVEGGTQKLIALQRLAGDLDAVELKAWDDMARVLAHEMLNSLTPIASLSESLDSLLRQGDRTADVAAALETIGRRSRGLMRFVERYRSVADVPEPQCERLAVHTLLADVERLIRPLFSERGIRLVSRIDPGELAVIGDRDLLEQVLLNVLRNAVDALDEQAAPQVEICCMFQEGLCQIDISDNGPGLLPAARAQLFVPFFTTKAEGSGIGLSLARRIAQRHGGQLQARANSPHGTVFRLSLPPASQI